MKKLLCVMLFVGMALVLCGTAIASPAINGAVVNTRIWNDAPGSTVTVNNSYPSGITIKDDQSTGTGGWANLHNFHLSADGGATAALFANGDAFSFSADLKITGPGNTEAGLMISPWWSPDSDGKFMINAASGEIACFAGRLPFYSFTASNGLTYTKGDTITLGVIYRPNSLSALDPATIEYIVTKNSTTYSSGQKAFDEGNPSEAALHGSWGLLDTFQVGGYFQPNVYSANWEQIEFTNMSYSVPEPATMLMLGLGSMFLARRRK